MQTVKLARHAMATRFELVLHGDDPARLRAAGEEALDEIDRLESSLSLFLPKSEIATVNRLAAKEPVRVSPETFELLEEAARYASVTQGAFDITIAPLMRAWGFQGGQGHLPDPVRLAAARECVGMHLVELSSEDFTVRFLREGVMLDLGAIGKGFAVDRAAETLLETGVTSALIHGGTSTVFAIGTPPDQPKWKVAAPKPQTTSGHAQSLLAEIELQNESISMSAGSGKSFAADGHIFGHVIDPRSGEPVNAALLACVVAPTATESDALATALLTLGPDGIRLLASHNPVLRALVVSESGDGGANTVVTQGIPVSE